MKLILILLLLASGLAAQERPSVRIDVRDGSLTEVLSSERTHYTTDSNGILMVDPPPEGLATMEPVLVQRMFQGWREKNCCPKLQVTSKPTDGDRLAPVTIGSGEPGKTVKLTGTPNIVFSGRSLPDFPSATFDAGGAISFPIQVTDNSRWILHVHYRGQLVEIRDQWTQTADF